MKKSAWNDADAKALVAHFATLDVHEDIALRVYSSRLLGRDPELVLHGGGNTSVKTTVTDIDTSDVAVLCVKGSGWDMANIEPEGHPAVKMDALLAMSEIDKMSDEDLVALQRRALLNPYAPNPSIEAILHAIIPGTYVDHTHANAIISLTNQPNGRDIIRELLPDAVIIPYVMPGFDLAKACQDHMGDGPIKGGMVLLNHGLFTSGPDARSSYEQHIDIIGRCLKRIEDGATRSFTSVALPEKAVDPSDLAPILRGALAQSGDGPSWILDHRGTEPILRFCNADGVERFATRGNATPDHSIRIKRYGLVTDVPKPGELQDFAADLNHRLSEYVSDYEAYFHRNNQRQGGHLTMLDPVPRVIYVPGVGLFGVGKNSKDAGISGDIAEATVKVITDAERIGTFDALGEEDLFDVEYWSLEQAKLAGLKEQPLSRKVVAVTGAASGLGLAIAKAFKDQGAEVAMLDVDADANARQAVEIGAASFRCDVADATSVREAMDGVTREFGGVDIVVSNAGIAVRGAMASVSRSTLDKAIDVNFRGGLNVAQAALAVMKKQGTGGALLFNVSKQALNPGVDFGPYGISKSALLALVRQLAIEHGADGISSNAVNADRIRTNLLDDAMIRERADARGVDPETYMRGNLLKREVRARDVAAAFVYLAQADRTTGAILTVDGGNVSAMVR